MKVAILNDIEECGQMMASLLTPLGCEVLIAIAPIDWEKVIRFSPDVMSIGLIRRRQAFNRPICDPSEDLLGYQALLDTERYPAAQLIPILLLGTGVETADVPIPINYDGFLVIPDEIKAYPARIAELAKKVKTRRRISGYICPVCGSRLTYSRMPAAELFCPRCHTAVVLVDEQQCLYSGPRTGGINLSCSLEQLAPCEEPPS